MSIRVLIVDDEQLARDRLARMVGEFPNYEVVGEAGNGIEAVQLAGTQDPEIVLMDIRMPGMDGLEAARHLAELDEPPAVIFCTAYEEHAIEAFDLQAVGYLLKPVRGNNLEAALGRAPSAVLWRELVNEEVRLLPLVPAPCPLAQTSSRRRC